MSFNDLLADSNLVAYWPLLDNASNATVADAVGSNTGTLQNANTEDISIAHTLPFLRALDFVDASDHHITLASVITLTGAFTIVFRARRDDTSNTHRVMGHNSASDSIQFRANTTAIRFVVAGVTSTVSHGLADVTAWNHYGLTRDSSNNLDFYTNGTIELDDFNTVSGNHLIDRIARSSVGPDMEGPLSDIAIFDRDLSAAEFLEWINGPEPVNVIGATMSVS